MADANQKANSPENDRAPVASRTIVGLQAVDVTDEDRAQYLRLTADSPPADDPVLKSVALLFEGAACRRITELHERSSEQDRLDAQIHLHKLTEELVDPRHALRSVAFASVNALLEHPESSHDRMRVTTPGNQHDVSIARVLLHARDVDRRLVNAHRRTTSNYLRALVSELVARVHLRQEREVGELFTWYHLHGILSRVELPIHWYSLGRLIEAELEYALPAEASGVWKPSFLELPPSLPGASGHVALAHVVHKVQASSPDMLAALLTVLVAWETTFEQRLLSRYETYSALNPSRGSAVLGRRFFLADIFYLWIAWEGDTDPQSDPVLSFALYVTQAWEDGRLGSGRRLPLWGSTTLQDLRPKLLRWWSYYRHAIVSRRSIDAQATAPYKIDDHDSGRELLRIATDFFPDEIGRRVRASLNYWFNTSTLFGHVRTALIERVVEPLLSNDEHLRSVLSVVGALPQVCSMVAIDTWAYSLQRNDSPLKALISQIVLPIGGMKCKIESLKLYSILSHTHHKFRSSTSESLPQARDRGAREKVIFVRTQEFKHRVAEAIGWARQGGTVVVHSGPEPRALVEQQDAGEASTVGEHVDDTPCLELAAIQAKPQAYIRRAFKGEQFFLDDVVLKGPGSEYDKKTREHHWKEAYSKDESARNRRILAYWKDPDAPRQRVKDEYWRDPEASRQRRREARAADPERARRIVRDSRERKRSERRARRAAEFVAQVQDTLGVTLAPLDHFGDLSPREKDVLILLLRGSSRAEAATQLGVKPGTVKTLHRRALKKLGVNSVEKVVLETRDTN